MKVLIADNSELIQMRLKDKLMEFGNISVVAANNGRDALDKIKGTKPELVILDIEMPDLNGFDVMKEVRRVDKDLKIIVLTFNSYAHYRKKAFGLGADHFFSKADDFEEIFQAVAEMILHKSTSENADK